MQEASVTVSVTLPTSFSFRHEAHCNVCHFVFSEFSLPSLVAAINAHWRQSASCR